MLRAPLSYDKTNEELEATRKANIDKWMAGLKKARPSKKSAAELEAECKMLRCLTQPKKRVALDYKHTMQNPHQDKQMLKFLQEVGLSIKQLHGQLEIQTTDVPKP
jgi:hypothetical protein